MLSHKYRKKNAGRVTRFDCSLNACGTQCTDIRDKNSYGIVLFDSVSQLFLGGGGAMVSKWTVSLDKAIDGIGSTKEMGRCLAGLPSRPPGTLYVAE